MSEKPPADFGEIPVSIETKPDAELSFFTDEMIEDIPPQESLMDNLHPANNNEAPQPVSEIWSSDEQEMIRRYAEELSDSSEVVETHEAGIDSPEERGALEEQVEDSILDRLVVEIKSGAITAADFEKSEAFTMLKSLSKELQSIDDAEETIPEASVQEIQNIVDYAWNISPEDLLAQSNGYEAGEVAVEDSVVASVTHGTEFQITDDPHDAWAAFAEGVANSGKDLSPETLDSNEDAVSITDATQKGGENPVDELREVLKQAGQDSLESDGIEVTPEEHLRSVLHEVGQETLEPEVTQEAFAVPEGKLSKSEIPVNKREILEKIDGIETVGSRWFKPFAGASPSKVFGHMPFNYFADMTKVNKRSFTAWMHNEFPDDTVRYESVKKWADRMEGEGGILQFAAEAFSGKTPTTQEVLEAYAAELVQHEKKYSSLWGPLQD